MLIEFRVENFRSIKDEMSLSLLATKDRSLPGNTCSTKGVRNGALLKTAVLYGANASGKTNVIFGLNVMLKIVLKSHDYQIDTDLPYEPFKLDTEKIHEPTSFQVAIIIHEIRYLYGFSYTSQEIVEEYLYYYPKNRKALIFHRKKGNEYRFTIDKRNQMFLAGKTPANVLYLSRATQLNFSLTSVVYDWFKNTLSTIGPADHPAFQEITTAMLDNTDDKKVIVRSLAEADLGIHDLTCEKRQIPEDEFKDPIPEDLKRFLFKNNKYIEVMKITSYHNGISFDFSREESSGTQRMYSLIGAWIRALRLGRVLVVDELDVKLHHYLSRYLIRLFHDETQNRKNGQLIFTTHDVNLLDQNIFRRDQIWFTEKDPDKGSTDLYSLVEFKQRKDKNIRRGYLNGRYGAIPFVNEKEIFENETD